MLVEISKEPTSYSTIILKLNTIVILYSHVLIDQHLVDLDVEMHQFDWKLEGIKDCLLLKVCVSFAIMK